MLRPLIYGLVASACWFIYQDVSAYYGVETFDKPFIEHVQRKVEERKAKAALEQFAQEASQAAIECSRDKTCT
ncbi:hypothetical protein [Shewanella acanthi]|uniref:hypothetical protein n=1 Tax=Shewanella acanthi TaxID=2864212 RepID=UPI001C657998|nr:hypothetical protein [Shewanella acanthi]MCH1929735.1 hypothetical protein [Shewanella shenzhenensis]QYJ78176.1 hypothetical protein K0H61_13815 [Shewanella acanthi]